MNNEKLRGFPFLVSRNYVLGYQTILAPDFLIENKLGKILADVAGGKETLSGQCMYREIHNTKVGDLTLIYRVIRAMKNGEFLTEAFGRQIDRIEGFVVKGRNPQIIVTKADFQSVHSIFGNSFDKFWEETSSFTPLSSPSVTLSKKASPGNLLNLDVDKPYNASPRTITVSEINVTEWLHYAKERFNHHEIDTLVFTNNSKNIIILSDGAKELNVCDVNSRQLINEETIRLFNKAGFGALSLFPKGNVVSITNNSGIAEDNKIIDKSNFEIYLLDIEEFKNLNKSKPIDSKISATAFNSSGELLACGSEEGHIYIWNLKSDKWFIVMEKHNKSVTSITFNPSGDILASASKDGQIKLFDVSSWREVGDDCVVLRSTELGSHTKAINAITFNATGSYLASASDDETVIVWDINDTYQSNIIDDFDAPVKSLVFAPDNKTLYCAVKNLINIWDVKNKKLIDTLDNVRNTICSIAASPDGRFVASGDNKGYINIWIAERNIKSVSE